MVGVLAKAFLRRGRYQKRGHYKLSATHSSCVAVPDEGYGGVK